MLTRIRQVVNKKGKVVNKKRPNAIELIEDGKVVNKKTGSLLTRRDQMQ